MKVGATQVTRLYAPAAGGKIGGAAASSQYGAQTAYTYLLVLQVVTAGALGGAGMASAIAETMVSRNCEHRVQCCGQAPTTCVVSDLPGNGLSGELPTTLGLLT